MGEDIAGFMQAVVPWPQPGEIGFINAHWTRPRYKGMGGKPFRELPEMLSFIEWSKSKPDYISDLYFCLSRQATCAPPNKEGKILPIRGGVNTTHLKAFWADIDGYKEYKNKADALDAIQDFVSKSPLPPPNAIVDSGGGYHLYWILKDPIALVAWRPLAQALWATIQKYGLKADPVTTDCVRILRIPGSYNRKQASPRPVRLRYFTGKFYAPEDLRLDVNAAPPAKLPSGNNLFNEALFPRKTPIDNEFAECRTEDLALDPAPIIKGCPHYAEALRTGGAGDNQGLWMQTVLGSTWFQNGRKFAHALSNGHSGYEEEKTDAMFDRKVKDREERGLGWPSCQTFENNGCTSCQLCPHKGKIRSPLNLGLATKCKTTFVPAPKTYPPIEVPYGFSYDNGYLGVLVKDKENEEDSSDKFYKVVLNRLYNPRMEKKDDDLYFCFTIDNDKGGKEREVAISSKMCASTQTISQALVSAGVLFDPLFREKLQRLFMSFIDDYRNAKKASEMRPFGWVIEDGKEVGFTYGNVTRYKDGRVERTTSGDPSVRKYYTPTGALEPWLEALQLVTQQRRPAIEIITAGSFGAPLLQFTAQMAGAVWAWSLSGGNKTTAVHVGISVWGHPRFAKEAPDSSHVGVTQKAAAVNNLPLYWDDVSEQTRVEQAVKTINSISQGTLGTKANPDGTLREDKGKSWQTMVVVASNKSIYDEIEKKEKGHAANTNRTFEFWVPGVPDNTPDRHKSWDAERILQKLLHNFGRMGEKYAELLATKPELADATVQKYLHRIDNDMGDALETERFWVSSAACCLAGAELANTLGCNFNIEEMYGFIIQAYKEIRMRIEESGTAKLSPTIGEKTITLMLKECTANTIRTDTRPGKGRISVKDMLTVINWPDDNRRAVHIRWILNSRELLMSKDKFIEVIGDAYSPSLVMKVLKDFFSATVEKINLCAGVTNTQGGPELVIRIPIPEGSPFEDAMNSRNDGEVKVAPVAQPIRQDQLERDPNASQTALGLPEQVQNPTAPSLPAECASQEYDLNGFE